MPHRRVLVLADLAQTLLLGSVPVLAGLHDHEDIFHGANNLSYTYTMSLR
jgi:hypothetical protein